MSTLAKRYAEALLSLAVRQDKVALIKEDIDLCRKTFSEMLFSLDLNVQNGEGQEKKHIYADVKGLTNFFKNTRLSRETKNEIVRTCLEDKVDHTTMQFLYVLIEKNRITYADEIFAEFRLQANRELGIKEGIIESVRPLDADKLKELEKVLSTDKERVVLIPKINDSLISGFKITFENEVIDRSMAEKINKMTKMLNGKEDEPWI